MWIYIAHCHKVSDALGMLVPAEKPSIQTLSEGLIVLLCTDHGGRPARSSRPWGRAQRMLVGQQWTVHNIIKTESTRLLPKVLPLLTRICMSNSCSYMIVLPCQKYLYIAQLCRNSTEAATKPIYRRISAQNAVREVNNIMLDAYLDGVDYFRLVLTNGTSETCLDSAYRLDELPVESHGVIVEISPTTSTLASVFFGLRHYDIFGWFLPLNSPTLDSAAETVCEVYRSRNMSRVLLGGSDVTSDVRWNSSIDEHQSTLDRYIHYVVVLCVIKYNKINNAAIK